MHVGKLFTAQLLLLLPTATFTSLTPARTSTTPLTHPFYGHESTVESGGFADDGYEDEYSEEEDGDYYYEEQGDSDDWDHIDFGEHSARAYNPCVCG